MQGLSLPGRCIHFAVNSEALMTSTSHHGMQAASPWQWRPCMHHLQACLVSNNDPMASCAEAAALRCVPDMLKLYAVSLAAVIHLRVLKQLASGCSMLTAEPHVVCVLPQKTPAKPGAAQCDAAAAGGR